MRELDYKWMWGELKLNMADLRLKQVAVICPIIVEGYMNFIEQEQKHRNEAVMREEQAAKEGRR